ncbi:MAG TPA: DUF4434 domain-containing protein [Verrucomicrobiota bacterium]|nr:DUF4434 domain-containing protein [Verrucomicrobiota bacterium]
MSGKGLLIMPACGVILAAAISAAAAEPAKTPADPATFGPRISLTLIPPSPISDRISLDIRGAVRNTAASSREYHVRVYLDREKPDHLLHEQQLMVAPGSARGLRFNWPARGHAGRHRVILVAESDDRTLRAEQSIEILRAADRSTRRLGGAWVDIYHFSEKEVKLFNPELGKMTDRQWRELVRAMHAVEQNVMVITMVFENYTHRSQHKIETEGYHGKAYYPSRLYPGRMPIASKDPLETIFAEADRLGMHVMPGVGNYAFFDYTPGALAWAKQVAAELWERYGHHRSFYGWYVTAEKDGSLGSEAERAEIVEFFAAFTPYLRRLAPDKPVMLAPNSYRIKGAEEAYRRLLPHLDILCPFGFHRMPAGDLAGEEAAGILQALCDQSGAHLWMDLESFLFLDNVEGGPLIPRPIEGLVSDFTRFGNFEKALHYQFPGLMSSPSMSRQPGGPASVRLYNDYRRYLKKSAGGQ